MEVVAVERELGSGQGDIMTRTPNSKIIVIILGHLALVMMLPSLPGIGSDVVLTPGNFQNCSHFYTLAPGSCVLGCKHQESRKLVAPPLTTFLLH